VLTWLPLLAFVLWLLLLLLPVQAHKDVQPCHLLMCASQLAISRKAAAEQLAAARSGAPPPFDAGAVRKGRYLGQLELRRPGAAASRCARSIVSLEHPFADDWQSLPMPQL
jgi:hypothetical protein